MSRNRINSAHLYEKLKQSGQVEAFETGVFALAEGYRGSGEIRRLFRDSRIPASQKLDALVAAFPELKSSSILLALTGYLVEKRHGDWVSKIATTFLTLRNEAEGRVTGVVRSAVPLPDPMRAQIESLIADSFHRSVRLSYQEDPALVAGFVAQLSTGLTYDFSYNRLLSDMKNFVLETINNAN